MALGVFATFTDRPCCIAAGFSPEKENIPIYIYIFIQIMGNADVILIQMYVVVFFYAWLH